MKTSARSFTKQTILVNARKHFSPLEASNFFVAYPELGDQRLEIDEEVNYLIHNTPKYLRRAVTNYFKTTFEGHDVKLIDKPTKKQGVQVNASFFSKLFLFSWASLYS